MVSTKYFSVVRNNNNINQETSAICRHQNIYIKWQVNCIEQILVI